LPSRPQCCPKPPSVRSVCTCTTMLAPYGSSSGGSSCVRYSPCPSYSMIDSVPAQLPRPPQRQRRLPARHDATTDQRRRWVFLGDRGGDALDPIGRRNGVIVDVRNVTAARGLRANVARQADPRLLDTLQPGMGKNDGDDTRQVRRIACIGCAVHHKDVEPVAHSLALQPTQTVLQIGWAISGADADGEVHLTTPDQPALSEMSRRFRRSGYHVAAATLQQGLHSRSALTADAR
jgi:hypothetical protein